MFLTVLTMTLSQPALAEDRYAKDDEAYLKYLDVLGEIERVIAIDNAKPQIDRGVAGIRALGAAPHAPDIGTVWTQKNVDQPRTEHWFLEDPSFLSDISDGYTLYMIDPTMADKDKVPDFLHWSWPSDTYLELDHPYYDQMPAPAEDLDFAVGQITQHTFVLTQDGEQVGAMLREAHWTAGGAFNNYVEHWLFFTSFSLLDTPGEELIVSSDPTHQFDTTGQFANHYKNHPDHKLRAYSMLDYDLSLVGSDF